MIVARYATILQCRAILRILTISARPVGSVTIMLVQAQVMP